MDPAIKKALHAAGISVDSLTEFPELAAWRAGVANYGLSVAATQTPFDDKVILEDKLLTLGGDGNIIRLRMYRPTQNKGLLPAFYWMHGGGMMLGTPEQDDVQMKQIAAETNALVVSVDYRLAPEFPFPVPLNDCYAGLQWLAEHAKELGVDNSRIAIGGASAGGGLAASLALMVRKKGGPKLVHQSLTYPMLDDRNLTRSSHQITSLGLWDRCYNIFGWESYLGTKDGRQDTPEFAVPAREQDLSSLPPAFIGVGALDLFRDEDIDFALRLMEAGVTTELHFYPGAVHGFDWYTPHSAMSTSFLSKRLNALKLAFEK
ncbi:alpha/beta hydrolase [Cesiribacter sp. SM1]|uniref:alpha/beta hydrolase n=1 Tax=Cesiribacter sp. SM1 TaxID=2861196 RepID=UPI001CD6FFAB|nr:alpha/beta hydrolase [Cesiribacter sp. SM1]